jgi:hypothetical protein
MSKFDSSHVKNLEKILDLLLDGIVHPEDLQRSTGLDLQTCSDILDYYYRSIFKKNQ